MFGWVPSLKAIVRRRLRFARSERGNVAVMFAVMLPVVIGGAGLGVETTYWYVTRLNLQTAADAAAHAGAMDMRTGSAKPAVITTATDTAVANGFDLATGTIAVNTPPLTGSGGSQAVEVILHTEATRFFTALFNDAPVPVEARAVAQYANAGDACILALNYTASKAALVSGSAQVKLTGCSVMSNSNALDALTVQGSSTLTTKCLISSGGVSLNGGVTMDCAKAVTKAAPIADPFKDLATPTATGSCQTDSGATRAAGRYCSGMDLKNTVALAPGNYYVSGGDFKINANAVVSGTGVFIYLASGAKVTINGTAQVNLTAQTTGTYKGMLFFGDRTGASSTKNTFNGTAASSLTGSLYFPSQSVDYVGNFSGANGCVQVVADTVGWSGSSDVKTDCSAKGMTTIPALLIVTLIE
jgi:Flp pilus assembly protein TadG